MRTTVQPAPRFGGALGHARCIRNELGAIILNQVQAIGIARAWRHKAVQQGFQPAVRFVSVQAAGAASVYLQLSSGNGCLVPLAGNRGQ